MTGQAIIGQPVSRVDGPAKVTGSARYTAEFDLPGLAYASVVLSTIPHGRVAAVETGAADAAPGVLAVIHHGNAPRLAYEEQEQRPQVDPKSGDQLRVFQDDRIHFVGQPLAVVVARSQEEADHAASLVRVSETPDTALTRFDPGREHEPSEATSKGGRPGEATRGDADGALVSCAVKVWADYDQPREHHNAIEPHATIAQWDGDRLTLYDKTQWPDNAASEIAHIFGLAAENVRVIALFVGGAFGSSLRTWPHVTIAALAARMTGRPVRLELSRRQLFTSIGFRPRTLQRVGLGADRDGTLRAIVQEAVAQTSTYEEYAETTLDPARKLYACAHVRTRYRLVDMHTNSPCPMRAPGIVTGLLALESAMDELAVALDMDPVELRLKNLPEKDQHKDAPWSSIRFADCLRMGAERFGWDRREPRPGAMREGGELVGFGMAGALYPSHRSRARARVTVFANGGALVQTAGCDMGPGTYTSMTQVAAETLGLPVEMVDIEIGDTTLPMAPVHGGSITMASVGPAVQEAARAVQEKLREMGWKDGGPYEATLRGAGLDKLDSEAEAGPGEEEKTFSSSAFGAVFAEVRVDPALGTVRVPRIVGAYDVGRVVNPKTSRSQCIGGMVQGIGMALLEEAEWDARLGRVMNANLAEYLVPVCTDVRELDVLFVPGEDYTFNPLGVKGLAEIALCGVAPAIGNAVYNATGRRLRVFPLRPERVIAAPRLPGAGRP